MKLNKLLLALCLLPSLVSGQQYGITVDTVSSDIGMLVGALGTTDLTGYSTIQAFITMENEDDFLSAISGDIVNPTTITTTTSFYHAALGAGVPNGINSLLFPVYPDLEYDTWVTIGLSGVPDAGAGEANVSTVQSNDNPWFTNFDPGGGAPGGDVVINDSIGGAWFALNGNANGVAGTDLRVLCGQFTTDGEVALSLYTQVFINGEGTNTVAIDSVYNENTEEYNDVFPTFNWPGGAPGCTDDTACNYDNTATSDDGSCEYPAETYLDCNDNCLNDADGNGVCDELQTDGCTDPMACNYNANADTDDGSCEFTSCQGCTDDTACNYDETATADDGSCTYPAETYLDCDGNCINDVNMNGTCDELETFGCTDATACNYDPAADAEDGSCTYPLTDYVDCDGNCLNDEDTDGICDEEEGCSNADACNYDPDAAPTPADYCLIVDTFEVHTAGALAGQTTYRFYVKCANPADFVSSVSGDDDNPTIVTTTTDFFQDELGGQTPNNVNEFLYGSVPTLQYDSYVTIGLTSMPDASIGEAGVQTLQGTENPWLSNFDPGFGIEGGDIVINDNAGGLWFALNGDANGIAANSANNEVLIAQLTTDGDVEGNFYVQIFENGDGSSALFFNFNIGDACVAPDDDCNYPVDIYGVDYVDCGGNCLNDIDMDGVCDEEEVPGCQDEMALNYDATATDDDGSCEYPASSVFEIIASSEDHTVLEDLIVAASLDGTLTDDGAWTVFAPTDAAVDALPSFVVDALLADVDLLTSVLTYHVAADSLTSGMLSDGQTITMVNGQDATITIDGNGNVFIDDAQIVVVDLLADNGVVHVIDAVIVPSIGGCTEIVSCNYNPLADTDDGSCDFESCVGCLNEMACNYDSTATINNIPSCTFPEDLYGVDYVDCLGECINDADMDGICDEAEVDGCIYEDACNYDPAATEDDGSCDYESCAGCTDEMACNYDMEATIDDGSCQDPVDIYGDPAVDCNGECLNDADGDGICDENEIPGCLDENACNYDANATDYDVTLCDYSCLGCTDSAAANYDPSATINDDSCLYCELFIDTMVIVMDVACAGDMNGTIMLQGANGGYGNVEFALDGQPFQNNLSFEGLNGGSYKVIAMDSLMCTDTLEISINEPAPIQVFAFANDVNCNGGDDGSIVVTSDGGTGLIVYELAGETNVDGEFEGLDAGPYTVFATDENGCEADINAEVEEPDAIAITVDATADPDNAANGSIDVTVGGGTGALSTDWDGPGGPYDSEDLSGLVDGTYTLTVTDENGCEANETVTLTTIGLTEVSGALDITLMPNPTNGLLTMELNQAVESAIIEVFDGAGRRVFRQEGLALIGQVQMDFSSLSDGVYQVRLTAGESSAIQQLMVRH